MNDSTYPYQSLFPSKEFAFPSSKAGIDPLQIQVGGAHYKQYNIQPIEYAMANGLNYCQANVVKYVTRYKDKGGTEDLRKAIHYLEVLIGFEEDGKENGDS